MEKSNIKHLCKTFNIEKYKINNDYTIDVYQDVNLQNNALVQIRIPFNNVYGNFNCRNNKLTSLINSPKYVSGYFNCSNNELTSLGGCPKIIDGIFICSFNRIESLKYGPEIVGGSYVCGGNKITSLEFLPEKLTSLNVSNNNLTNLKFISKYISDSIYIYNNDIEDFNDLPYHLIKNVKTDKFNELLKYKRSKILELINNLF